MLHLQYTDPVWRHLAWLLEDWTWFRGAKLKEDSYGTQWEGKEEWEELPPQVKFCLFFGYRGDNILLKGADDGSIALRSQLDPRAQSEAARCFGFNENHVSILFSKEVIRRHKEMLSNVAG